MAARPIVVIAPPRSGSTLLCEWLHSHPDITCYGEVLNAHGPIWQPGPAPADEISSGDPVRLLEDGVWARPEDAPVVGFKLLEHQFLLARDVLAAHLGARQGLRILQLSRDNLLARFTSALQAEQTGVWFLGENGTRPNPEPVEIDPDVLDNYFRTEGLARLAIAALLPDVPRLELTYEEMIGDPDAVSQTICAFLGVSAAPLTGQSVRMARSPLSHRIANYAALKTRFAHTPFAGFFDGD